MKGSDDMIKVYTAKIKTTPLDIDNNYKKAVLEIEKAIKEKADLIVFPKGFLTGVQLGVLANVTYVRKLYNEYIDELLEKYQDSDICILADNLTRKGFENTFIHKGDFYEIANVNSFNISSYNDIDIFNKACYTFKDDSDLVILNATEKTYAGRYKVLSDNIKMISDNMNIPIIVNLGGYGSTSHPDIYYPAIGSFSKNSAYFTKDFNEYLSHDGFFSVEYPDFLKVEVNYLISSLNFKTSYNENPLIPTDVSKEEYVMDLFNMQSFALQNRLDNTGIKKVVLALSGGLDSTLSLLVCLNTFKLLNYKKEDIIVLNMPAMGTSQITKNISKSLCDSLGLNMRTIDITKACKTALNDIGSDENTYDTTFENVQARMRTLNALNIANKENALMIGTGDLSEIALGFSTYGGDHLASYNPNSSVSKTVIRTMLNLLITKEEYSGIKEIITTILNNPISPELLPSDEDFSQKTEEILAPYKLIDFFIYCLVIAEISPNDTIEKAKTVFKDEFSEEYLKEKLKMFYKKFIQGQFKRSASPESARLTHVHLSGENRSIPSDSSNGIFELFL